MTEVPIIYKSLLKTSENLWIDKHWNINTYIYIYIYIYTYKGIYTCIHMKVENMESSLHI